ncbi:MAG TPA: hypothetical protein VM029_11090, partial [Opitutaceae bacterium]|nr:hypothetical protein [Opitutaceae bacterium]
MNRTFLPFSRAAALAALLLLVPPSHAASGNGNSATGTTNQVAITSAAPDYATNTLLITGANFGTAPFSGTVRLFSPPNGTITLTGATLNAARQEIVVPFPASLATFPGTYLLTVTVGSGGNSSAEFDVAFGAIGLKGDKGDKGDAGATGTTGAAGATGATGAT